jgi:hypothetical protein
MPVLLLEPKQRFLALLPHRLVPAKFEPEIDKELPALGVADDEVLPGSHTSHFQAEFVPVRALVLFLRDKSVAIGRLVLAKVQDERVEQGGRRGADVAPAPVAARRQVQRGPLARLFAPEGPPAPSMARRSCSCAQADGSGSPSGHSSSTFQTNLSGHLLKYLGKPALVESSASDRAQRSCSQRRRERTSKADSPILSESPKYLTPSRQKSGCTSCALYRIVHLRDSKWSARERRRP